jgi:hypothetical protein
MPMIRHPKSESFSARDIPSGADLNLEKSLTFTTWWDEMIMLIYLQTDEYSVPSEIGGKDA